MTQVRYDFINSTDSDVSFTITLDPLTIVGAGPHRIEVDWCDPKQNADVNYTTSLGIMGPVFSMTVPAQTLAGFIVDGAASFDALPKGVTERVAYRKDPWPPPPPPTTGYSGAQDFLTRYYAFNRGNDAVVSTDVEPPVVIERRETHVTRVTYVAVPVPGYGGLKSTTP